MGRNFPGTPCFGTPNAVTPKPVGDDLSGATVRLGAYGDSVVDGIEVNFWMKIGLRFLCEVAASPLPVCILGMDVMSEWGLLPLPSTVRQKAM